MKGFMIFAVCLVSLSAFADSRLADNGAEVVCSGEDNQSIYLNAKRTKLKYEVEGESLGFKKIVKVKKKKGSVTYTSEDMSLTLSDKGDKFQYNGSDAEEVDCK